MRSPHPHGGATPARPAGFTLIEMIMVLMIVGTLAVFLLPKLLDLTAWRLQAYADELRAQTAAMQRLSLLQRRPVVMTIDTTGVRFDYVAGGNLLTLDCPATASPCIAEPGPRTATFNAANSGSTATSSGAALPVTIAYGSTSLARQLESETGLFRALP